MDAKELRIGNLIMDSPVNGDEIKKVESLYSNVVFCENDHHIYNDEMRGIPLTEEWLLKFGFQRHDEGSVSAQFSYGTNPVTQDYIIYLKWIKDYENDYQLNGFPFYQNGHFEIKTVHQLQNLYFALTGEELSVIN